MLKIENLTKVYDDGTRALDGVTFNVPDGQFLIIIGPVSYTHLTLPTS